MTKTTCPTCGSKCRMIRKPCSLVDCRGGNHLTETCQPLPQPDLTKLREVFKEYIHAATRPEMLHMEPYIDRIIREVREVLDAETSNSEHNRR